MIQYREIDNIDPWHHDGRHWLIHDDSGLLVPGSLVAERCGNCPRPDPKIPIVRATDRFTDAPLRRGKLITKKEQP